MGSEPVATLPRLESALTDCSIVQQKSVNSSDAHKNAPPFLKTLFARAGAPEALSRDLTKVV
jgi:hypothetical protein